jgi:hypothetical protein
MPSGRVRLRNIHTAQRQAGEVRGQIKDHHDHH